MIKNFEQRHIGVNENSIPEMLAKIGVNSVDELINKTIPIHIQLTQLPEMDSAMSEAEFLEHIKSLAKQNQVFKSYIGQGYYNTYTPSVILRNVFENPGWYTQYTPYQAEIAQGRLESLLNFQTMVSDLCGLPIANASLLDEATAAAEAMSMLFNMSNKKEITHRTFLVDQKCFTQTKNVVKSRAKRFGIEINEVDIQNIQWEDDAFGLLIQYPNSEGQLTSPEKLIEQAHAKNIKVVLATDLLALTMIKSPGVLGADIAVGNTQRFGIPLGFGGPHAAFFATKEEFKREIPGRIIGISVDAQNNRALRMALQTREQHIKREKASSNICTAQALLANMAAMYAVYHGPYGLRAIADLVHKHASILAQSLSNAGFELVHNSFFDTISIATEVDIKSIAEQKNINLYYTPGHVQISIDETTTAKDIQNIISIFAEARKAEIKISSTAECHINQEIQRSVDYLQHEVFNSHHSETEMMRYLKQLENKDLALNTSMISLGSCTMKLNAATQLMPLSWTEFASIHPLVPQIQASGYHTMMKNLEQDLCKITGFDACSFQPNSGAQGEYAGLYTIMKYHESQGNNTRNVVLIPISAHGTNPATASMMGMKIVIVACDEKGNISLDDLKLKAEEHKSELAALMVTYPSTHGVFEESIKEICDIIHTYGGQVYMDGANMNAQVMYTSPANIGADVCHLNLHKTFAIPHGGGGPGMGPICVKEHLRSYLPQNPFAEGSTYSVSSAPYGSALILIISYAYIKMLGAEGLRNSTAAAILNANYMKAQLSEHYEILYAGSNGMCAHEFILDLRPFKKFGIEAEDIAKRLMDFNFHAPTLSFPVPGTFMIEPTESESKAELDRFCEAMIVLKSEINSIAEGIVEKTNSPLHHAPHTQFVIMADEWTRPYSRSEAAYALPYVKANKFWPSISRINNTHGDRNLVCTCEPTSSWIN